MEKLQVDRTNRQRDLTEDIQSFIHEVSHFVSAIAPHGDATQTFAMRHADVQTRGRIQAGVVQYAFPTLGGARVALADGGGIIRCRLGQNGGYDLGARSVGSYPPGTEVYVYHDPSSGIGTILCSRPPEQPEAADVFCDYIVQGSGVGVYASPQYSAYIGPLEDAGGAITWAGDGPLDQIPGDQGFTAVTGVGIHLDNEMAYLRTSEVCGVFAFREDGHLRVAGESVAVESPARIQEEGISVYECYRHSQEFFYPWELLGQVIAAEVPLTETGEEAAYGGPNAAVEPEQDLPALARIDEFGGYIGQGRQTIVSIPRVEGGRQGVFREQIMLSGGYSLETADQMYFAKVTEVPVVTRKRDFDVLLEDDAYAYSGSTQDGPPPIVRDLNGDAVDVRELYSYASGWKSLHAATYHPGLEITYHGDSLDFPAEEPPDFSQTDHVPQLEGIDFRLDHRSEVALRKVLSLFAFLPDGGVVLQGGRGAELRLVDGVAELSGTGVYINAAKTVSLAGSQVSIRGQSQCELVSSTGAVRIKAETDLNLLGGNAGRGGVLIESRSASVSSNWAENPDEGYGAGVVIKAAKGHVSLLGGDLLLKTGPSVSGHRSGLILIDAGNREVVQRAASHQRFSQFGYFEHFGTGPDSIEGINVWQKSYSRVNGSLGVQEQLIVGQMVQSGRGYTCQRGHYASTEGERFGYRTGRELYPERIEQNIEALSSSIERDVTRAQEYLQSAEDYLETDQRPLNSETLRKTSFGFPSSQGYGASQVVLRQPQWQLLYGQRAQPWEEPSVSYAAQLDTRPWPGQSSWERPGGFLQSTETPTYFDSDKQRPKNPGEAVNQAEYESAQPPTTRSVTIRTGLLTIPIR